MLRKAVHIRTVKQNSNQAILEEWLHVVYINLLEVVAVLVRLQNHLSRDHLCTRQEIFMKLMFHWLTGRDKRLTYDIGLDIEEFIRPAFHAVDLDLEELIEEGVNVDGAVRPAVHVHLVSRVTDLGVAGCYMPHLVCHGVAHDLLRYTSSKTEQQ